MSCFRDSILPLATVVTPNVPEALKLLENATGQTTRLEMLEDMVTLAKRISQLGPSYVLLKGGHLPLTREGKIARNVKERQMVVNVLCNKEKTYILRMDYQNAKNTHGTGCSLACKADSLLLCHCSRIYHLFENNISKSSSLLLHLSSGSLLKSPAHHAPPLNLPR